jgi:cell division septation protein DedD
VGAYTSPHLLAYNERVRIDGVDAGDAELVAAFEAIEAARGDTLLTYFEYGTLAALWLFERSRLDLAILEVGLGGRLDATNLVDPDVAVITTVDLDHQDYLGDDREAIGFEKAGIARAWKPLVLGDDDPPSSVLRHAYAIGASAIRAGCDFFFERPTHAERTGAGARAIYALDCRCRGSPRRRSCATPPPRSPQLRALGKKLPRAASAEAWPTRTSPGACSASNAVASKWSSMSATTRRPRVNWPRGSPLSLLRDRRSPCSPLWATRICAAWPMPWPATSTAGISPVWRSRARAGSMSTPSHSASTEPRPHPGSAMQASRRHLQQRWRRPGRATASWCSDRSTRRPLPCGSRRRPEGGIPRLSGSIPFEFRAWTLATRSSTRGREGSRGGYNSRAISPEADESMEPALKQRVVGAVVLVALAVIFLPMLIKGPAPESGVSDVPLKLPDAPQGDGAIQTRELPLVAPGAAPASGVVGMDASDALPDDGSVAATDSAAAGTGLMPAATAAGDYAVSFGRYATAADADKVVAALRASQLTGYQESITDNGRTLYRVRIGPFATQADAEAARLRAAHVRDDVSAKVVVLNDAATASAAGTAPPVSQPGRRPAAPVSKPEPLAETKPAASKPAVTKPVVPAPAPKPAPPPATTKPATTTATAASKPATPIAAATRPSEPAAASTGFAVQLARSRARSKPTSCATAPAPPACTPSSNRCAPTRACSAACASGRC